MNNNSNNQIELKYSRRADLPVRIVNSPITGVIHKPCEPFEEPIMAGYVKLCRSEETNILLAKHPKAFVLLSVIAMRAKRTSDGNTFNLKIGESLVGDHDNYGMTRQGYRTAIEFLEENNLISTSKNALGTVATMLNYTVFDINVDAQQPDSNQIATTNKNKNKKERIKEEEKNNYQEIADYWNSKDSLAKIRSLTSRRKLQLAVRLKETAFQTKWKEIIDRISMTPFCTGDNDRNWKADFDWLIKNEDNYTKVIEGKYGDVAPPKKVETNSEQWERQCGGWLRQSSKETIQAHSGFLSRLKDAKFRKWSENTNPLVRDITC